ncbi:MAG: glycoside hydrolase family 3 protein [Blautia marasmi]
MPLGEHYVQSGEATSNANIQIPQIQQTLFNKIYEVNQNIAVILFSGRPLDIRELSHKAKAILQVWMPGTEGAHAIMDILTGIFAPSGKLPMSFPTVSARFLSTTTNTPPAAPIPEQTKTASAPNT